MAKKNRKNKLLSRRGVLSVLGGSLLAPFMGSSGQPDIEIEPLVAKEEQFKVLLKPDGTVVKVKTSALKNAKFIKKSISNKSFLGWLNKEELT